MFQWRVVRSNWNRTFEGFLRCSWSISLRSRRRDVLEILNKRTGGAGGGEGGFRVGGGAGVTGVRGRAGGVVIVSGVGQEFTVEVMDGDDLAFFVMWIIRSGMT